MALRSVNGGETVKLAYTVEVTINRSGFFLHTRERPCIVLSSEAEILRAKFVKREQKLLQPALKYIVKTFWEQVYSSRVQLRKPDFRIKNVDKFLEKALLRGKPYKDPIAEITDQIGVRVVTYFASDIDKVHRLLLENVTANYFTLHETVDKRFAKGTAEGYAKVGYGSLHLILGLGSHSGISEELKFEVQIRSLLQDAWADIEHSLNYKTDLGMPAELRRRLYVLAGMLELADREFDSVRDERKQIKDAQNEAILRKDYSVSLSQESLTKYVQSASAVDSLIRLSHELPESPFISLTKGTEWSYIIKSRERSGITTIRQLDDFLQATLVSGRALEFVEELKRLNKEAEAEAEASKKEFGIFTERLTRHSDYDFVNWLFMAKFPGRLLTCHDDPPEVTSVVHNFISRAGRSIFPESYEVSKERLRADID